MFTLTIFEILLFEGRFSIRICLVGDRKQKGYFLIITVLLGVKQNMWFYLTFKMRTFALQLNQYYQRTQFSQTLDSRL